MPQPLLAYYGDDFTGASAVMEVLSFSGIQTALFLAPPSAHDLNRFPDLQAVGVAGIARAKDPAWMHTHLPPIFEALRGFGAPVVHYKVCSTFDSGPEIGSIGVAAEIGKTIFQPAWIPLVVGAPAIGRYQIFGTLFAAAGGTVHRLDRHPVMSRHPITPMQEADLGRHLAAQTGLKIGTVDFVAMAANSTDAVLQSVIDGGADIVALDAMDDATLREAGRLIWNEGRGCGFAVGSQGLEYALVSHWRATGALAAGYVPPRLGPVRRLFAVCGSCAQTTAEQIRVAEEQGFEVLEFDAAAAVDTDTMTAEIGKLRETALRCLSEGRDVIVTTARGPEDPAVARMRNAVARAGLSSAQANEQLGRALGSLVAEIRRETGLSRVAIGGGDTSGHAITELGIDALTAIAPLAPGAPLCRAYARGEIDGLEVTLKGGQMGDPDFFVRTRIGHA